MPGWARSAATGYCSWRVPAMMWSVGVVEQRPHFAEEELHGHHVGAVGEAADEEDAARVRDGVCGGAEAIEIDSVGEGDGGGGGDDAAVLFAHGDDAVHGAPGGGFEFAPEVELAAQFPAVVEAEKLLVEIEGDVVFHQDGAGGGAIGGVLRELGEFQLGDGGAPLADGLLERGAEGGGSELLDDFGTSGEGQVVAAGAADQDDLGADGEDLGGRRGGVFGEGDQHQVELFGGAAHEVVHADGAAVGEREGQVGAGDQDARLGRWRGGRGRRDAAIGEGEEEVLGVGGGSARTAAEGDGGGGAERAFAAGTGGAGPASRGGGRLWNR